MLIRVNLGFQPARDPRPLRVTCAASAAVHPSTRVMLAALKFFLGQDEREDEDSDDDEEAAPAAPSREDMYKAKHKVGVGAEGS